jgi:hypothetical protein
MPDDFSGRRESVLAEAVFLPLYEVPQPLRHHDAMMVLLCMT